jgi:TM2 domain-containing membrane protein YozV
MLCSSCGKENDGASKFCVHCGKPLTPTMRGGGAPPIPAPQDPQQPPAVLAGKNPTLAVVLSIVLPGAGQFYNDDTKKGAVMLVAALLLCVTGIGYLAVLVWSAIDAYNVAIGKAKRWET